MKKIVILLTIIVSGLSANAQKTKPYFSKEMELVSYELNEVIIKDSLFFSDLNSVILPNIDRKYYAEEGKQYYYGMYFSKENNSLNLGIDQSEYPGRKQKDVIGYFEYKGYLFIVNGDNGKHFFEKLPTKRTFSYEDFVSGIFMLEDDIPSWFFKYINSRLVPKYEYPIIKPNPLWDAI